MNHTENRIFEELKHLIDCSALIWLTAMGGRIASDCSALPARCAAARALWALLWLLPTALFLWAAVGYYHKKARILAQKQQIAMMAYHAKQVMEHLQRQIPDTLLTDSKIKMRYLARHGIDIDNAMVRLGHNVERYNELVLAFLQNSDKYEDSLYDLMQPDTLLRYGANAHTLRLKANELGLVTLTDTAFFHEIEAYAGCYDVVRANWKSSRLSLTRHTVS